VRAIRISNTENPDDLQALWKLQTVRQWGLVILSFSNFCLATSACSKKPLHQAGGPDKEGSLDGNPVSERESVFCCRKDEYYSKNLSVRKLNRKEKKFIYK